MEYNYESSNPQPRVNKLYSTSPTSSSSSSSSSTSSSSILPPLGTAATGKMSTSALAKQQKTGINTTCSQFATMSSSTSQIFATAASFNICQNDTVYYARETIHLLVKFLSINSTNPIFRSLYTFAPDNLSWLWSFVDWESPLDMSSVLTQSTYTPFKPAGSLVIDESELYEVNKLFLDAPLIQYKYREPLMIGDVYKFLEHVSKTEQTVVAKALFLTYFPRFKEFIDNPLKDIIQLKVLKSNQNIIKLIDETIKSLIKSRYPSIDEYKQNIKQGQNLPSYIRTLLKENNYFQENEDTLSSKNKPSEVASTTNNKNLNLKLINENVQTTGDSANTPLYSPFSIETKIDQKPNEDLAVVNNDSEDQNEINEMLLANIDLNREVFVDNASEIEQPPAVFFPVTKTIDYMKLLEKSNRINDDLDHVSFDKKKAMLCNKFLQEKNLDSFGEYRNDNRNINNLLMNQFYGTFDENNNNYEIEENLADYQDSQLAAKCFDLVNSSSETTTADLNLATLTLPQLNQFHETFNSNGHSSAMASPKQDSSFYYQKDMNQCQNAAKLSYSRLPNLAQTCLSPSSPKPLFHTPKTPSSFTQYQEKAQDYSVWSNGINCNQPKLPGTPYPTGNGSARFYSPSASMTPPPSASFKTTPLSVITNGMLDAGSGSVTGPIGSPSASGMLSPSHMFARNQFNRLNESLNLNSATMQDDLNTYLKHQFYGSPVTRQTNKLNDYRVNSNKLMNQFDYSNARTQRFNSNTELNNNSNVFFQRNDLLEDLNSSKSPSSTSSGPVVNSHFSNTTYQRSNNSHHNQHQHTWAGRLPPKTYSENSIYSRKVFLGGLPWDVNQQYLVQLLQKYGSVKLEIPGKDQKHPRVSNIGKVQERSTPGYVYIIFEHESAVQRMLADCRKEIKNGGEHYYYTIFIPPTNNNNGNNHNGNYYFNNNLSNKRGKAKEVEVIPWNQEDTSYVPQNKTSALPAKIDAKTTIFVGALHGMLNAHGLAKVMNEVFGEVIHAGLDTDKYKYPIGSGRVTFRNRASYVKAIKSKFVTIKANLEIHDPSPKFEKTIQIDPYLEDAKCFKCNNRSYYFCRNENCLDYYCENCWKNNHDMIGNGEHLSLSRQNKPDQMNKSFK